MTDNLPALIPGRGGYGTTTSALVKATLQALRDHPDNSGNFTLVVVRAALSPWRDGQPNQPHYNLEVITEQGRRARVLLEDSYDTIKELTLLDLVEAALIPEGFPQESEYRSIYNVIGAPRAVHLKFRNRQYVGYEFEELTRPSWLPPIF